jgi:thiamine biosynthesis protein ThiS
MIAVKANGETVSLEEGATIEILLSKLNILPERLAVELNKQVLPRSQVLRVVLKEGDVLEIVKAIGGG